MSLLSSLETLRRCVDSINNIRTPSGIQIGLNATCLQYTKKKVQWDAIKELILDFAYNAELGFLTPKEMGLYQKLSAAYAETLLCTNNDETTSSTRFVLDSDELTLFESRLQDKLQEKLDRLHTGSGSPSLSSLQTERNSVMLDLVGSQCEFAETVSRICTSTSKLFREVRSHAQAKMNLMVASVLTTEARALKAQASILTDSILNEAQKNESMIVKLQHTKTDLLQRCLELEKDVDGLERLLRTYQNNDDEYHNLVRGFGECQRQLALRAKLLTDSRSSCSTRLSDRRSLSAGSLPTTANKNC